MFGGFNTYSRAAEYSARAEAQRAQQQQEDVPAAPEAPQAPQAAAPPPAAPAEQPAGAPPSSASGSGVAMPGMGDSLPPPVMSRDELVSFFSECGEKLLEESFLEELVQVHGEKGSDGVSERMLEVQRAEIIARGHDYDKATAAMRWVPRHFPGDSEVSDAMQRFMRTCRDVHNSVMRRAPVEMDRESLLTFLSRVKERVSSEEGREEMVELFEKGMKMHMALHELQVQELRALGFSEEAGKDAVGRASVMYPDDAEVTEAMKDFEAVSQRAIVMAMRARPIDREKLQTSGEIDDDQILLWFSTCNWLMEQEEIKTELKAVFETSGKPPAERICDLQREMFEYSINVEREFGCQALNNLEQRFQRQPEHMQAFRIFLSLQNRACQVAMGKEEELLKAEKEERERRARQARLQQLQAKAMMEEHGALMDKMEALQPGVMKRAQEMSVDERKAFARTALREFAAVLKVKNSLDPAEKMAKLGQLSDEKLEDFILLQTLMGPAARALMQQQQQQQQLQHAAHSHAHSHGRGHEHHH